MPTTTIDDGIPESLRRKDSKEEIQAVRDKAIAQGKAKAAKAKLVTAIDISAAPKGAKAASAKPTAKAKTPKGKAKGQSKTALVADLLTRKEGCTRVDILKLRGGLA